MKILAVGDTHGDETPLSIAKDHIDEVEKVIFHGDYADSFDSRWPQQKEVLEKILDFKFENSDKVDLLWGNHDHAYISDPHVSGHQNTFAHDMREFFLKYLPYFQIISVYDKWIFSHAGVSGIWMERYLKNFADDGNLKTEPLKVDDINQVFAQKYWSVFDHLSLNPYGDSEEEGPLWIRPRALLHSGVTGYNQCVGHTEVVADASSDDRIISLDKIVKGSARMQYGENLYQKYVLIDSRARDIYAIIDTDTNEVTIERYKE